MNRTQPGARALRRMVYGGFIAFFIGFFAVLAALDWLLLWSVEPDTPWWEILHYAISAILISVVGGLASCAGAVLLVDNWESRRSRSSFASR